MTASAAAPGLEPSRFRRINLAVLALGGQGGGVLADWILNLAEANGYRAQGTSIAGVAQRTGATIYYMELASGLTGEPVLALSPTPGDVDVVIASELMEAGRGMVRGLVSQDRTVLISSTHRIYAIAEKSKMSGALDRGEGVLKAAKARSKRFIGFDMERAASETRSVISAPMFGALAASGALPFAKSSFEEVIRAGGMAVEANLRGFQAGFEGASAAPRTEVASIKLPSLPTTAAGVALLKRIEEELPLQAREVALLGVKRLLDYQDLRYAELYLDRLQQLRKPADAAVLDDLVSEAARRLALWMSYEDVIRVADLKTRKLRSERVRGEVGAEPDQILGVVEFMHPRLEELCDILPRSIGAAILKSARLRSWLAQFFRKGRFVKTSSVRGFLLLLALASLRPMRPGSLRFSMEQARIERWLQTIALAAPDDPQTALELVRLQSLLKGYGDTFERGLRSFDRVMGAYAQLPPLGAAKVLAELRSAALADEEGRALSVALDSRDLSALRVV